MNILKILTPRRIIGNIGEDAAARMLKKKHYKILERNYTALGHEIDIIARLKDEIVFIEVKTRSDEKVDYAERPAAAVTPEKQQAIIKAASYYISYLSESPRVRFDIVEVILKDKKPCKIEHIEAAFTKSTAFRRQK